MAGSLNLFWRLMTKPLGREPVRTSLTVLAVALGVAVVLAIELAGEAATGSFHSSLESLSGSQDFEITATGGVPEEIAGRLAVLPYSWRVTPRIESFAVLPDSKQTVPLIGLDLIGEGGSQHSRLPGIGSLVQAQGQRQTLLQYVAKPDSVWASNALGKKPGDELRLLVNDRALTCTVRGVFSDESASDPLVLMDIASAQEALGRGGRLDRILIGLPEKTSDASEIWRRRIQEAVPKGVQVRPAGATTVENQRMLAAFRWNLRLLSYIALIVGAFLIYNTISVSVVRRRAEIGILRALGAGRSQVLAAFLLEAACFGLAGALLGIALGRLMASFTLKLMAATVNSLYVSSRPGEISLSISSMLLALVTGVGIAIISAWVPAREAAGVAPIEAMARGRQEFEVRVNQRFALRLASGLGIAAAVLCRLPPVNAKPVFGYGAALLAVAACVFAIPCLTEHTMRVSSAILPKMLDVEALLASRGLAGSLRRTTVLVAALCTAVAMTTAVAIMVGSFRQTVVLWMNSELPADLYLRPAGSPATDQHPVFSVGFSDAVARLPGVHVVQRLRAYEFSYQGMPATLASIDLEDPKIQHSSDFLSGQTAADVLAQLRGSNAVIVSEPFSYKHRARRGDSIQLSLGGATTSFRIADVYYDYSSERGAILMDRAVLLRFLPDEAASNVAVFLAPGASSASVRSEIERLAASMGTHALIFSNSDLRRQAVQVFDRTFAITYALEAIAVLVAIMGVAGALLALVIDRKREFGLLRYLGASSAQLRKLILTEAGLLGLLANLSGVLLGIFLSFILIYVINKQSFGWTIRFHWPFAILLGAISLVSIATLLAGLYPASTAVRLNPVEVVHEE